MALVGVFAFQGIVGNRVKAYAIAPLRATPTMVIVEHGAWLEWIQSAHKITPALRGRRYRRRPSLGPDLPEYWREVGVVRYRSLGWRLVRVVDDARA